MGVVRLVLIDNKIKIEENMTLACLKLVQNYKMLNWSYNAKHGLNASKLYDYGLSLGT